MGMVTKSSCWLNKGRLTLVTPNGLPRLRPGSAADPERKAYPIIVIHPDRPEFTRCCSPCPPCPHLLCGWRERIEVKRGVLLDPAWARQLRGVPAATES